MLAVDTVNPPYEALLRVARARGGHDEALFRRLEARFIPTECQSRDLRLDAEAALAEQAQRPRLHSPYTMADALKAYVEGRARGLAFVEAGPDGVAVVPVQLDDLGVPSRDDAKKMTFAWSALIPPADPEMDDDERALQLAGGFGPLTMTPNELASVLEERLRPILTVTAHTSELRVVLLNRLRAWPVSALLLKAIESRCTWSYEHLIEPEDVSSLDETVDDLLADAPIRFDYDLVRAMVDPATGAVKAVAHNLFPQGATRNTSKTRNEPIVAHYSCRGPVQLVVVATRTPAPPLVNRPVVFSGTLPELSANDSCNLTIRLDRPGQLAFSGRITPTPTPLSTSDIIRELPPSVGGRAGGRPANLDLVFMVDLIGADELVAQRKAFVKETVAALKASYDGPGALRVALLGVTDELHVDYERRVMEHERYLPKVQRTDFTTPERMLEALDAAKSLNHPAQDYPCALDEAIESVEDLHWRQSLSRRSVVIVTSRPPHPEQQGTHRLIPSPTDQDWQAVFEDVRRRRELRVLLVQCPTSWRRETPRGVVALELPRVVTEYTEACWKVLGPDGRFMLEDTAPDALAAEIDDARGAQSPSIRLPVIVQAVAG